jgi:hypothetical protein
MAQIVRKMILSLIAKILIAIKLNCLSLIARSTHRLLSLIAIKLKKVIGRQEPTAQAALRSLLAEAPPLNSEFEAGIALLVAFF